MMARFGKICVPLCRFKNKQSNENTENFSDDAIDEGFCGDGTGGDENGLVAKRGGVCQHG